MVDLQTPPPRLTVVIPAYQAAETIVGTVYALRAGLAEIDDDGGVEIIVVDDGSTDDTALVARGTSADRVVTYRQNRGKGHALRHGFAASRGRTVAFTDADLAYAPADLERVVRTVEEGAAVAIGSRRTGEHVAGRAAGLTRHLSSFLFNLATRPVLRGGYLDTQCGLKAFHGDRARAFAGVMTVTGFGVDVELLHLAERVDATIVEVAVQPAIAGRSTIRLSRHVRQMLSEVASVAWRERTGAYDKVDDEVIELDPITPTAATPVAVA